MDVVPDVLQTVWAGGIVVNFDTLSQFLFQSAAKILAEYKGKCSEQELHNKQEDNKAKVLKQNRLTGMSQMITWKVWRISRVYCAQLWAQQVTSVA